MLPASPPLSLFPHLSHSPSFCQPPLRYFLEALSQYFQDKHFPPFKSHPFICKPDTFFIFFKGRLLRN